MAEYEESCRLDASTTESATSRSIFPHLSELSSLQPNGYLSAVDGAYRTLEDVAEDELGDGSEFPLAVDHCALQVGLRDQCI
jgi:hypothetical protein